MSNPFCRRGQRTRPGDRADTEAGAALRTYAAATTAGVEAGDLAAHDTVEPGVCELGPSRASILLAIDTHLAGPTLAAAGSTAPADHPTPAADPAARWTARRHDQPLAAIGNGRHRGPGGDVAHTGADSPDAGWLTRRARRAPG